MDKIAALQEIIDQGKKILFFTGAGVSTDSHIPDFRSTDGLYNQSYAYPPETIISHSFFEANPEEFYRFYRDKMVYPNAVPNYTHTFIATLEKKGKSLGVVTQNIDGLHTAAGSKHVWELHGSVLRNYCEKCHTFYPLEAITSSTGIPRCKCGGTIKPDVVLYEEPLDAAIIDGAIRAIEECDVLIVCGTSLLVYPAANFIRYYRGDKLVLINRDSTSFDSSCNLVINDSLSSVLPKIKI